MREIQKAQAWQTCGFGEVRISRGADLPTRLGRPRSTPKELEVDALIDTGASVTIIDTSIVEDMPLRCFGYCPISGFDSQDSGSGKAGAVPEPSSLALLALGATGLMVRRRTAA